MKKESFANNSLFFVIFFLIVVSPYNSMAQQHDIKQSMVKIYTTQIEPDYTNPWRLGAAEQSSGSGFIIENDLIMTNAHVVSNHTFIHVRIFGDAKKHQAFVVGLSHEADLALLSVADTSLFDNIPPLSFGDMPNLQDNVSVYGYPEGGDNLSITKGTVSRIEHHRYVHSYKNLLAMQIDAAVNAGNSGGAVIMDGKVVGVVMQSLEDAQNTSYAVPIPIIQHVLADLKDRKYEGFPTLSIRTQRLDSKNLKQQFHLPSDKTGVLAIKVHDASATDHQIQPGDILLQFDGNTIADDGTIEFRTDERTNFAYFLQQHQIGEPITIEILREGKTKQITFNATKGRSLQLFQMQHDVSPPYFIFGGFVFSSLSMNYLCSWGEDWIVEAPVNYLNATMYEKWNDNRRQIVILVKVLPHEINTGYHNMSDEIVTEVDGVPIRDMNHFISLIQNGSKSLVEIKLKNGVLLVINREEAKKTHNILLKQYGIPNPISEN